MVMAIFKDRKLTSWTPKNQVLKEIAEKPLMLNSAVECYFNCAGFMNSDDIKSILQTGKVDFSESEVKDHDKRTYIINIKDNTLEEVSIVIYPDSIVVSKPTLNNLSCECP